MIKKVFLTENALACIREEVGEKRTVETGGALVGYYADESVVITHASGPGPRACKKTTSVLIDGDYTTKFCRHLTTLSNGYLYYVGDWHIHLINDLRPSITDHSALKIMLNHYPDQDLISAIFYKDLTTVKVYKGGLGRSFNEVEVVLCSDPECMVPFLGI
ncbi:Mov34/MPN/PAD-1 family protein [Brevibacillus sp. M2.1A]|uniref:Mov34/MPN/PAD-1 family protein n=1 Tax=Brevibacillus sp. M2.1A TaxID=2738980 RepID=UPI00156BB10C|nr:Mov34/MPN/PAD-1 family protein [Brevibacillus sp. M2.1A]MCC8438567.1 Mov34/MPN/PAD-1 family protein [Brevibacillus sp. M2.1A]